MSHRRLLLFDLDGTLLSSSGFGRRALEVACERLYGWPAATRGVDFCGATDPLILRQVFERHGRSAEEALAAQPSFFAAYLEALEAEERRSPNACSALPGALPLLGHLRGRLDCLLGVLTGNIEGGARIKLRAAGIGAFYLVGAFGDEAPTRPDLLPLAVSRANALGGAPALLPADAVVIGDSPRDIAVARAHGARAVAVATGAVSPEALAAHGPDILLDGLHDIDAALDAVLG